MRDLAILVVVFGLLPLVLARPHVGVLLWSWLGYMNPHKLAYGFAFYFPFAQIVGLVTLFSMVFSRERKWIPLNATTIAWLLFVLWMNVTTYYALNPENAALEWDRTMKIQLFALITVMLIRDKTKVILLVWTIAISIGFYGIKGGVFALLKGGAYLVWGPRGTFIEGNNELALALIMIIPLFWFLFTNSNNRHIRWSLLAAMVLCILSVLSSHSRGAFLSIAAMLTFFMFKSGRPFLMIGLVFLAVPALVFFMPEHWFERMASIQDYQSDGSAMGRINAWYFAFNLALDRPFLGGGFDTFTPDLFMQHAPNPTDVHDSHSIYFEVMGEHGFVGFGLFLLIGICSLFACQGAIKRAKKLKDGKWIKDLASMLQVSLVGYATGGLFLGLAYFDLYYHLVALVVIVKWIATQEVASQVEQPTPAPVQQHSHNLGHANANAKS